MCESRSDETGVPNGNKSEMTHVLSDVRVA